MIELYDEQKQALSKMHHECILVGGTGSGKTLTSLSFYKQNYSNLKLYIITTAKKRNTGDWLKEASLVGVIPEKVDSWNNIQKYLSVSGAFVIFDEAHQGGMGVWADSFVKIAKKNKWVILSATPADNYNDLRSVFIARGFFKNKTQFNREHVIFNPHVNFPQIDRYINTGILERYRRMTYVDMNIERHTTQHHERIRVDYDKQQYKEVVINRKNPFNNYEPIQNASEYCYTLRRIVNSDMSRIFELNRIYLLNPKIVVYYNFDYELDMLRDYATSNNIPFGELNGHKHDDIPKTDTWLYFVHYYHSEAWNCIETDTMVFFSQSYSYRTMIQAAGRIDRLNTKFNDLSYYHLISGSSIDQAILRALSKKKKFNESRFIKIGGIDDKKERAASNPSTYNRQRHW